MTGQRTNTASSWKEIGDIRVHFIRGKVAIKPTTNRLNELGNQVTVSVLNCIKN